MTMSEVGIDEVDHLPTPSEFYEKYIKRRKPVVLRQCSVINFSLDDVKKKVDPKSIVEVNVQSSQNDTSFSPKDADQASLPFADFLNELETGKYYLTTQDLGADEEGRPNLCTTPVTELADQFELRPGILGNLIPMTYSLWLGCRKEEKGSSGLHHDFHDNLYCLIKGRKRLQIAKPSSARLHTMRGSLHTLHENGRIVYQEQIDDGMIRPDGALERVEDMLTLELQKEQIERELANCKDEEARAELEGELDQIEEDILDFEMEGSGEENDDDDSSNDSQDDECSDEPKTKKSKIDTVPVNFVIKESPKVEYQDVNLSEGDMLYLPAGWFHEVFSSGGVHMAFNYWMHPPDTDQPFENPYKSEFWPRDWAARKLG